MLCFARVEHGGGLFLGGLTGNWMFLGYGTAHQLGAAHAQHTLRQLTLNLARYRTVASRTNFPTRNFTEVLHCAMGPETMRQQMGDIFRKEPP